VGNVLTRGVTICFSRRNLIHRAGCILILPQHPYDVVGTNSWRASQAEYNYLYLMKRVLPLAQLVAHGISTVSGFALLEFLWVCAIDIKDDHT
jgi:hypothetical protein